MNLTKDQLLESAKWLLIVLFAIGILLLFDEAGPYIVLAIGLYFLPYLIARSRHHHNANSVLVINLFLGWTFIGWVVALAMAVSHVPQAA